MGQTLSRHPQISSEFEHIQKKTKLFSRVEKESDPKKPEFFALQQRLIELPPGKKHWRDYETLCIDILNFLFAPSLGVPELQTRSEDGLDRRDAVFRINRDNYYWNLIREDFRSRMVVAEFKNYSKPISQTEVGSIEKYLYGQAFRNFGLLCCRKPPSKGALACRRKVWVDDSKMIVILSDADIIEMLQIKADNGDPMTLVDLQIHDFLCTLAP